MKRVLCRENHANCLKIDKQLKDIAICISGLSYRRGQGRSTDSRNLALARLLVEKGLKVYAWDELLGKAEWRIWA